jgi:(p)ppGpp synthase/HD superfamily hydrolase
MQVRASTDPRPDPILGDNFVRAVAYAVELHGDKARKATTIPYLTHLFAVCSLVLEDGGSEKQAIAALLHDGPEDCGGEPILAEIRRRFGDEVADIVNGLSDAMPGVREEKPPWQERKDRYLSRLGHEPEPVLRVSLADKLHNARSIALDRTRIGEAVWSRFNADRGSTGLVFPQSAGHLRGQTGCLTQPARVSSGRE